jgi:cell wall-associated NlpC family hydrolase
MKRSRVFHRVVVALTAASLLLLGPNGHADPQPTPHKKKHPVTDSDDDNGAATPSPSPASSRSKHHPKHHTDDEQQAPTASPAADSTGGFHKSADEHADDGAKADKPENGSSDAVKTGTAPKSDNASSAGPTPQPAATSTIESSDLRDFDAQPEPVRNLLNSALELTRRNLTYTYGSADPAKGGLDCSGTIYYLLQNAGFEDVPRSASEQYAWVRRQSRFYAVLSKKEDSFELKEMRPGDLLFWTGTYNVDHDPPVTHTMLYLGRRKKDGKPLMMGASDGRPYDGEKRNGVSVFDFKIPPARSADSADAATAAAPDHSPDFAGYGPIPGMAERNDAANRQAAAQRSPGKDGSPGRP